MSIFLSAIFILGRSDFVASEEEEWEHSLPAIIITCTFTIRLTVLPLLFLPSCKIWAPQDKNGAQKNVCISKSNAPTLLKISVSLDHMYTKDWIFFPSSCVMSTSKNFATKGNLMQHPLLDWGVGGKKNQGIEKMVRHPMLLTISFNSHKDKSKSKSALYLANWAGNINFCEASQAKYDFFKRERLKLKLLFFL